MGSARGGRRPRSSREPGSHQNGQENDLPAGPPEPVSTRQVLEMVAANPVLQGAHVEHRALVEQGLELVDQPTVRKYASTALAEMLQGTGPSFGLLQGAHAGPAKQRARAPGRPRLRHRAGAEAPLRAFFFGAARRQPPPPAPAPRRSALRSPVPP